MAWLPPTFNLVCDIYTGPLMIPPMVLPRLTSPCQLRFYKTGQTVAATGPGSGVMSLLFPAGTDVRPSIGFNVGAGDVIECPRGSGRGYSVLTVDDVAKGFPNEYRLAVCAQSSYVGGWPLT